MKLLIALLLLLITKVAFASADPDRVAAVTCSILKETRNMDSSYRVEKVNDAREKINEDAYLMGDNIIIASIGFGLCELLVKNHPDWQQAYDESSKIAAAKQAESRKKAAARAEEITAMKAEYTNETRMIFLTNISQNEKFKITNRKVENYDISRAYAGEFLDGDYEGYYSDCVVPKFNHIEGFNKENFLVKENIPLCKTKKSKKLIYSADYDNQIRYQSDSHEGWRMNTNIVLKKKKNAVKICLRNFGISFGCFSRPIDDFVFGTGFVFKQK